MDSARKAKSQYPRHRSQENFDRFIPNREAMDIGFANAVLTERRTGKENQVEGSASSVVYQKLLAETLNMNRRILTFKSKPPAPIEPILRALLSSPDHKAKSNTRRHISQTAEKILDAPDLSDDFYLNLLDWGSNNILAIALGSTVYLWDASNSSTTSSLQFLMKMVLLQALAGLLMGGTLLLD